MTTADSLDDSKLQYINYHDELKDFIKYLTLYNELIENTKQVLNLPNNTSTEEKLNLLRRMPQIFTEKERQARLEAQSAELKRLEERQKIRDEYLQLIKKAKTKEELKNTKKIGEKLFENYISNEKDIDNEINELKIVKLPSNNETVRINKKIDTVLSRIKDFNQQTKQLQEKIIEKESMLKTLKKNDLKDVKKMEKTSRRTSVDLKNEINSLINMVKIYGEGKSAKELKKLEKLMKEKEEKKKRKEAKENIQNSQNSQKLPNLFMEEIVLKF